MITAVIGLGAMGLPMASNLAKTFEVRGYDIAPERVRLAIENGIVAAESAAAAVSGADTVLLAVRNQAQLEQVLTGADPILPQMESGATLILISTVGDEAIAWADPLLAEKGVHLVDAPVSGGPVRAGNGDLLTVVGASDAAWERAYPVLDAMSSTLVRVGDTPGKGQAMKTVNQLLCGVHIAAAGEALALANKLGLDQEQALQALMAGAASSFMLGDRGERMLHAYDETAPEVKSRLDIFVKDMGIVLSAAQRAQLATPLAAAAAQSYLLGEAQGLGAQDDSAVIRVVAPRKN
ncbi:NAD(P)-dependent oxidoreductase [Canibacter sp. lx-45]|uniref:NAD(P)-dependent oxidoreductase n=1 Tax=Canibacter zhuwentaonis TaxID=2837491 RepID=UPI001BDD71AA|nr:NAD(P)-dependent oxidoreductase [Canibacter zhuwentaonis]MBT1035483.1 NAD(P)-dependent oxidoreductase [Canibacter zhuwentaonis]